MIANRRPNPREEYRVECPNCEGLGRGAEYWGDAERWYGCVMCGGHGDVVVDLDGYEKEELEWRITTRNSA